MNQLTITPRKPSDTGPNFNLTFTGKQIHFLLTRYLKPLIAEELNAGTVEALPNDKYKWACYLSSEKLMAVKEILELAMEKNGTAYSYSNNIKPKKA